MAKSGKLKGQVRVKTKRHWYGKGYPVIKKNTLSKGVLLSQNTSYLQFSISFGVTVSVRFVEYVQMPVIERKETIDNIQNLQSEYFNKAIAADLHNS